MKKACLKLCQKLLGYLKRKTRTYIGYAILAPLLLAWTAIEQHTIPPMAVMHDVAIYMLAFLVIAGVIWAYVWYIEHELRQV